MSGRRISPPFPALLLPPARLSLLASAPRGSLSAKSNAPGKTPRTPANKSQSNAFRSFNGSGLTVSLRIADRRESGIASSFPFCSAHSSGQNKALRNGLNYSFRIPGRKAHFNSGSSGV